MPAVTRRLLGTSLALALLAGACGSEPPAFEDPQAGAELRFVPQVADSLGDAGRGAGVDVDAEGNPHVSYVALEEPIREGEPEAVRPIGAPEPPAVLVATLSEGAWEIVPVAEGTRVSERSDTAIAVDADGANHVIWSERPVGVVYSTDADGGFAEPQRITDGFMTGLSLAAAETGTLWAAWVEEGEVRAASGGAAGWTVEDVAVAGVRADLSVATAIAVGSDGQPMVAFTGADANAPMVARRDSGGSWSTEEVESGGGGYGVSMALDPEGNPVLAYYTQPVSGEADVRVATATGEAWEATDVGTFTAGRRAQAQGQQEEENLALTMSTGVAATADGVLVTWYAGPEHGLGLATGEGGEFREVSLTASAAGAGPAMGTGAGEDPAVAMAWHDTADLDLKVATEAEGEVVLANPGEETTTPPPTQPTGPATTGCEEGTIAIAAPAGAAASGFDTTTLEAPPDEGFTVCFDNQDPGLAHNWALYQDEAAADQIAQAGNFPNDPPGPVVLTADVDPLQSGDYFYRCDYHATTMTGTLTIA
jgi:plastocyanin